MTELERTLAQLDIDWPATPVFALRRRRRRVFAGAVAIVLAVAVAFAVPASRSSILRFFHLGGETIERVQTLPPAESRSLERALGERITRGGAAELLGRPFAAANVPVYRSGRAVSAIVDRDLLFTELQTGSNPGVLKKFVDGQARVEGLSLGRDVPAIWIYGRHAVTDPMLPTRLAGNTLVWQRGSVTYRLEGRGLTLPRAIALARRLR
jgi:hypothetical protein